MKIFFSEHNVDYSTYTFDYAVYALMESIQDAPEIYAMGFLPWTGDLTVNYPLFYLARSLRINMERFGDTSENRRINRKLSHLNLDIRCTPIENFDKNDQSFRTLCNDYIRDRFEAGAMTEERLDHILESPVLTHIFTIFNDEGPKAYVLCCMHNEMIHYWFAFFDVEIFQELPLGKWIMWRVLRWAKDANKQLVYLGTCYGTKSLYKVRDHKGVEYFSGFGWNSATKTLKQLCHNDGENHPADGFKRIPDKNEILKKLSSF